ncbi:MAG: hypothetical protein ABSE27_10950 [Acidobacteriaceae bacterium]|jgi:hypothetical protein
MSKCILRSIFTVLIYAGVVIFLFPYLIGRLTNVGYFVLAGLGLAVVCGILRCCCTEGEEGDCTVDPVPAKPAHHPSTTH